MTLTPEQWEGVIALLAFLGSGFALIPLDRYLEARRRRRRIARRSQAHPRWTT